MFNRAEVIDENFKKFITEGRFPESTSPTTPKDAFLRKADFMELFESQILSRHLDLLSRELKNKNLTYYTIGSSGHEGNASLGKAFRLSDMAFLHYRSGGFMIQRSRHKPGSTPIYDMMLSFLASTEEPIAGGRHKVFGSLELNVPPQTSTIASHLPKAVGAALSIGKAKALKTQAVMQDDSIIMCSFGDASANHSTAVGAMNFAAWAAYQGQDVPIVFVCEDNGIGISTETPENWIQKNYSNREGLTYLSADGLNLADSYLQARRAVEFCRKQRKPVFLHLRTIRLMGHAGSDLESTYRSLEKMESVEFQDPLLHSARIAIENGFASPSEIVELYETYRSQVAAVGESALTRPQLASAEEVRKTVIACTNPRKAPSLVSESRRKEVFGTEFEKLQTPQHLGRLLNWGLTDILARYPQSLIFGEDVAAKGGVYNITDSLYKRFGDERVFNTLLDEQSILGTAIGMAHNGLLPIPEIQFLAYVHNAEDQIRGEASTLAFFSKGQFTNPMVIRIAGLAYQKGFGGHFHNDNSIAVFRDIPGLIVAVPSKGDDGVKMMRRCVREAFEKGRVVVFIEPIALYMTRDLHSEGDKQWCFQYPAPQEEIDFDQIGSTHFGKSGKTNQSPDLVILSYGNGHYYSLQAAQELAKSVGISIQVLDLRWIAPIAWDAICKELKNVSRLLIVEECRKTGSLSEALVAGITERLRQTPKMKVIAADDCFIPLGKAAAAGLPKKAEIIAAALELIESDLMAIEKNSENTNLNQRGQA